MPRKPQPCGIDGCGTQAHAAGLCARHYGRKLKYGTATLQNPCRVEGCARDSVLNASGVPRGKCARHVSPEEGERRQDGTGYIRVYRGGKWVHEHREAMEAHLGRALVRSESVHHRNGDRTDNRLENLELWFSAQPSGQRVDDLIQYMVDVHRERLLEALRAAN